MRPRLLLLLALFPALVACRVERSLLITSEPPGALVRINGKAVGETPLEMEFVHYGKRRVTMQRAGHCSWAEEIELVGPWYARFPLDYVSEVFVPVGWKDRRHLHVDLEPGDEVLEQPQLRSVFERANTLRRAGAEGPRDLPPVRTRSIPPVSSQDEPPDTPDGTPPR